MSKENKNTRGVKFRTLAFIAIWLLLFALAYSHAFKVSDIFATYFAINIWQLFILIPCYYFTDKRLLNTNCFSRHSWCFPVVGVLASLVIFIPLGYVFIFGSTFFAEGLSYLIRG